MRTRLLVALTVVIALMVGLAIWFLDPERLSALGGILSGAGGLLAVIWFSAGLRYQAQQLSEQRAQFSMQFHHLQETSRRDALLLAKGVLDKAEEKAVSHNGSIASVAELPGACMNFAELKPILESTNPHQVMDAYQGWMKKEGAALVLLGGVKSAAEVYLRSIGVTDIDYSKSPESFYLAYSSRFAEQPFFNSLAGVAQILAEFLFRLEPGRNAAMIAFLAANAKVISRDIIKMDKLHEDIKKHRDSGREIPAIARDL